jgi:hypothetical protein
VSQHSGLLRKSLAYYIGPFGATALFLMRSRAGKLEHNLEVLIVGLACVVLADLGTAKLKPLWARIVFMIAFPLLLMRVYSVLRFGESVTDQIPSFDEVVTVSVVILAVWVWLRDAIMPKRESEVK